MRAYQVNTRLSVTLVCCWMITVCLNILIAPKAAIAENPSRRVAFNLPNEELWQQSTDNAYTATGSEDTFAWSEEVFAGDLVLNVDIESNDPQGEGAIILYGSGAGWSKGCLIFNIANDFQSIRAHTIFDEGRVMLWYSNKAMKFQNRKYTLTIEILGDKATLTVNGKKFASIFLPPEVSRQGRIGLYKYRTRPPVTFSNLTLQGGKTAEMPVQGNQKRIALIIGNSDYKEMPLRNPVNDAEDMSKVLRLLGFTVITKTNVNQRDMEDAINEFFKQIQNGDVALFYFSGHGSQVNGENYLIPVGENIQSESDVRYKSVNAGYVLGKMEESGNRTNILILDACRNNPFKSFRSLQKGLTVMNAAGGTFIAYATAPGTVALDGTERNGVYTKYLLESLQTKSISIEQAFKRVLRNVEKETTGQQIPWTSSSLREDFYFNP